MAVLLTLWRALLFASPVPLAPPSAAAAVPLYAELQPLVGGPGWLPLHVALLHGDAGRGGEAVQLDFLPQHPTATATATALLTGGGVAGVVRCRKRSSPRRPARRAVLLGYTTKTADALARFAETRPPQLQLLRNDCWTFAAAVARHALE